MAGSGLFGGETSRHNRRLDTKKPAGARWPAGLENGPGMEILVFGRMEDGGIRGLRRQEKKHLIGQPGNGPSCLCE